MQPDVIRGLRGNSSFRGKGLLGRFLYAVPPSNIGNRKLSVPLNDSLRKKYNANIRDMLEMEFLAADILLSTDARNVFDSFVMKIERRMGDDDDLGQMQDWAGKLSGAILRVAGILHVADNIEKCDPSLADLSGDTMRKAVKLADYLIAHAKLVFYEMVETDTATQTVLRWIKRRGEVEFTRHQISESLKSSIPPKTMDEPLFELIERGYIRLKEDKTTGRGRKAQTYVVNPDILNE